MQPHTVTPEQAGQTLAALLRVLRPGESWSQVKSLATQRRVAVGGSLCMDPARRLKPGEIVEVLAKPARAIKGEKPEGVVIRHLDDDVVVVEKASGVSTVRHPAERDWDDKRRTLVPTLDDVTQQAIANRLGKNKHQLPRLRIVHRLDKETSGLVVFGRSVAAERELGRQFKAHTVVRRYIAIVSGSVSPQTFSNWLVRDRGDGRRGSGAQATGKHAVTHVDVLEKLPHHTVLVCQLETGRTHQIRIHLAEAGHPVCGEKVYSRRVDGIIIPDTSAAPRLALHAVELGFVHPTTVAAMHWEMPPPPDLVRFLERIRGQLRMEIKWDDTDPNTDKRRFVKAERFAGRWQFFCRRERRGIWEKWTNPSRAMWEDLLEALERRRSRQEGIELADVAMVRELLANWRDAPSL